MFQVTIVRVPSARTWFGAHHIFTVIQTIDSILWTTFLEESGTLISQKAGRNCGVSK